MKEGQKKEVRTRWNIVGFLYSQGASHETFEDGGDLSVRTFPAG